MTKLLPFDLEAAKAGAKVLINPYNQHITPEPCHYIGQEKDGKPVIQCASFGVCTTEIEFLYMAPTPVKRWRVVYRGADDNAAQRDFEDYDEACQFSKSCDKQVYVLSTDPFSVEVMP